MIPIFRTLSRSIRNWSPTAYYLQPENCTYEVNSRNYIRKVFSKPTSILRPNSVIRIKTVNVPAIVLNRKMATKSQTVLYKMDQSPTGRAAMMIVDILGLDIKTEDLNPVFREQDEPRFVRMNPMRTIPILDEGDFSLGDSHAIMLYLLDKYGKSEHEYLYPKDKRKRATINQRLFFECGILFPRLRAIMAPTYKGRLTELTKYMRINNEDAYRMLEEYLSQNKYIAGDTVTVADFSVYPTTQSLDGLHRADEIRFPKLRKWLKTMSELDVVKRVNEPGGEMHAKFLIKIMEMNKEKQDTQKSKL